MDSVDKLRSTIEALEARIAALEPVKVVADAITPEYAPEA